MNRIKLVLILALLLSIATISSLLIPTLELAGAKPTPAGGKANSCSDTDGGIVVTVFGTVSGYFNKKPYSYSDTCVDSGTIKEYYCSGTLSQYTQQSCGTDGYTSGNYCMNGDVYRNYTDYFCGSGVCSSTTTPQLQQDCVTGQYCSSGACYWNDSCSDTDGGFVMTVQGTTSGYFSNQPYSNTDVCQTNTTLTEFYCSGSYSHNSTVSCMTNTTTLCSNGACV
jgi:hypothetical protein